MCNFKNASARKFTSLLPISQAGRDDANLVVPDLAVQVFVNRFQTLVADLFDRLLDSLNDFDQ